MKLTYRLSAWPLARLRQQVGLHRRPLLSAFALLMVSGAAGALIPQLLGRLIDRSLHGGGWSPVLLLVVAGLLLAMIAQALFSTIGNTRMDMAAQRCCDRVLHLAIAGPLEGRSTPQSAAPIEWARLSRDTGLLENTLAGTLPSLAQQLLRLAVAAWFLVAVSPLLGGLVLTLLLPALIALVWVRQHLRGLDERVQSSGAQFFAYAEEGLVKRDLLRVVGRVRERLAGIIERSERSLRLGYQRIFWGAALGSGVALAGYFEISALIVVGAREVQSGRLSAGALVSLALYGFLFAGSAAGAAQLAVRLASAIESLRRLDRSLPDPHPAARGQAISAAPAPTGQAGRSGLQVSELLFSFGDAGRQIRASDFRVACGECVCIVGPSGTGKTTLLRLLCGLLAPDAGSVTFDGKPAPSLIAGDARRVAFVDQQATLLDDTLYANLVPPDRAPGVGDIEAALACFDLLHWAQSLPQGLQTPLTTDGVVPSQGQRMRLALARAHLQQADLLVLDEPTAALDAVAAERVTDWLHGIRSHCAIVIASHAAPLRAASDRVYALRYIDAAEHTAELVALAPVAADAVSYSPAVAKRAG